MFFLTLRRWAAGLPAAQVPSPRPERLVYRPTPIFVLKLYPGSSVYMLSSVRGLSVQRINDLNSKPSDYTISRIFSNEYKTISNYWCRFTVGRTSVTSYQEGYSLTTSHKWRCFSAASRTYHAANTVIQHPTQLHYPDTTPARCCLNLVKTSARRDTNASIW